MRLVRLRAMVWKELRQLRRDPGTVGMLLGVPVLQLLLFGYAIQTEVRHLPTAVLDQAGTAESRDLVQAFQSTGNFRMVAHAADRREIEQAITAGRVRVGIVIPPDYARRLHRGESAPIQVLIDAADPLASQSAIAAAAAIGQERSLRAAALRGGVPPTGPPLDVRVRPLFNPGLRSAVYIVPGIIGVLLSITMMLITAMAIVRERERGTLEQLIVTPITRTELMLGKVLPFVLIGYVQITAVLVLGYWVFDVPIRGDVLLFYAISFAFILANLGMGLMISTVAKSQREAMMMGYFFILPNILLSGFMFPREAMPVVAQWIGWLFPLTFYLEVLRGIILRGAGMQALWQETLILTGFAVLLIGISVTRFRKKLD
jgi:ABC-2 type transport system permease protein